MIQKNISEIYAPCLGACNNRRLNGVWINAIRDVAHEQFAHAMFFKPRHCRSFDFGSDAVATP